VEPDDLRTLLDSTEPPLVVDLRSEVTRGDHSIPGAQAVAPQDLPRWAEGMPRDKEIVVACD
jgi:rhodanese-related sulfurtransferase